MTHAQTSTPHNTEDGMRSISSSIQNALAVFAIVALAGCASQLPVADTMIGAALEAPVAEPLPGSPVAPPALVQVESAAPTPPPEPPAKPTVNHDLWVQLRANMHLDLHLDQRRVQQELEWMKRNPRYLPRLESRLQTYLPYICEQVALRNMPTELCLLPIVESALDVYAFSHGGAAGPWQFLRGTARQYGLVIDDWYDGRRDVIASTDSALDYLSYLHRKFDDWYLALAGYNAGEGNVGKALRRDPNTEFFGLRLPRETRYYVPRLLALASVIKTPEKYGVELPEIRLDQSFASINIGGQFQIDKLSSTLGLDQEELLRWNPAFNRWATSPRGPHRVIVPKTLDLAEAQAAVDAVPANQRVDWKEIKVRNGDTLSGLAARHATDVAALKAVNDLRNNQIRAGRTLLIPVGGKGHALPRMAQGKATHVVAKGESLWTIARAYDVGLTRLMKANHIGPRDPLAVGKKLVIPGTAKRNVVRTVRYKVRRGDSLAKIAKKFNVTIKQIASWNQLDIERYLRPGQGLVLHVDVVGGR